MPAERFETVIVGGGQGGLATGYHLAKDGRSFVILDAGERIGDPWRTRWDSLKLYSPAATTGSRACASRRPERHFRRRTRWPTTSSHTQRASSYPCVRGRPWTRSRRTKTRYVLTAGDQTYEADNVVVATGVMQKPYVPSFAQELDPRITQLHSSDYRNLTQLQEGPVLVVGASHSGADIAYEAAAEHETILSGPDTGQIPASVETRRGRMGFRVLFFAGSHILTMDTPMGRKMRPHIRHGGAPLLRYRKKDLLAAGVERVLARAAGVQDGLPVLDDGRVLDVRNVSGAPASGGTSRGSTSRSSWAKTDTRCSTAASSRRLRGSTSSGCCSSTRSPRCSSAARERMPSGSRSTSRRSRRTSRVGQSAPYPVAERVAA